jgi:hypothetical protein
MSVAFVDTTILADLLLKRDRNYKNAAVALNKFSRTELPVYAIKEFSAGPLQHWVWLHNKLVDTQSLAETVLFLQRESLTPRKYLTATALQALAEAMASAPEAEMVCRELEERHGPVASWSQMQTDSVRLEAKTRVLDAWTRRRRVTTAVVEELICYEEKPPTENRGLLRINSRTCRGRCAVADRLRAAGGLAEVIEALKKDEKNESRHRRAALKQIYKKPNAPVFHKQCKRFGDAVFVILAPLGAAILTTNVRDFLPMASALGKEVVHPASFKESE